MKNKKIFGVLAFSLVLSLFIFSSLVLAEQYLKMCLHDRQSVPNASNAYYTCDLTMSDCCCELCVRASNLDPRGINPIKCAGQTCNYMEGGLDEQPPEIVINKPIENSIQTSRGVLLEIQTNENSKIERYDSSRRVWIQLCTLCSYYSREISFGDGYQNLRIKAIDKSGNSAETNVSFFVDSKAPRIKKTLPKGGKYVSSEFWVQYDEDNVKNVNLNYGNSILGYGNISLSGCESGKKQECNIDADLSNYDNNEIKYWFSIEDIAGNVANSKRVNVFIDETSPVIDKLDYTINGKYVYFNISIDEENLDEIKYIDWNDRNPRWRKLCSRIRNNKCEKRISFKDGLHDVYIQVTDKAGNSVGQSISFFTDSKKPKIGRTWPKKGFASGTFNVEFKEENPKHLILNYGNLILGYDNIDLNLGECIENRGRYQCEISVDLSAYNGQEIDYWFNILDIVNNTYKSKNINLDVDTTLPVINNPYSLYTVDGRYVYFNISIDEENLDEIKYIDWNDRNPRWRKLCSRIRNNKCEKRISFKDGLHDVYIQVTDKAGNSVGQSINFEVSY